MVLVVVCVLEARHFPRCVDSSLVVEGHLNGEVLSTDPVPQSASLVQVQTELAWEMEPKALQQHKLHRTPIKLKCFTIDYTTNAHKFVGYVLMDIQTAHRGRQAASQWHKVLNTCCRGPCPELHLSLTVEEQADLEYEGSEDKRSLQGKQKEQLQEADHLLTLTLDTRGGYYSLGAPSLHQHLFILSVTLDNPQDIPQAASDSSDYYFYYKLLGCDITSEVFKMANFKPERASIRIKSTRDQLGTLLATQGELKICLCQGKDSLAEGWVPLKLLSTQDTIEFKVEMKVSEESGSAGAASVEVRVHIEKELQSQSPPLLFSGSRQLSADNSTPQGSGQSMSSPTTNLMTESRAEPTPHDLSSSKGTTEVSQSVKRNLTPCFEEASVQNCTSHHGPEDSNLALNVHGDNATTTSSAHSSPSSSTLESSMPSPLPSNKVRLQHLPDPHLTTTIHVSAASTVNSAPLMTSATHDLENPLLPSLMHHHQSTLSPTSLPSHPLAEVQSFLSLPSSLEATSALHHLPISVRDTSIPTTASTHSSTPPTCEVTVAHSQPLPHSAPASTLSQCYPVTCSSRVENHVHQFQYSIDIGSLHNVQLGEGLSCYLKYTYPFFGSPYPVVVQPPVPLLPGTEQTFAASCCAFTFATNKSQLERQLHVQSLPVEVWATRKEGRDNLMGIAKVPLCEVLSSETLLVSSGSVKKQKCSLKVPITPPNSPHFTCGYLHCVLTLEDHGSIQLSTEREKHARNDYQTRTDETNMLLPNSTEYQAAMELEMWKLSEEEAYREQLKSKEAAYLSKLGEEWRKREAESQRVFAQKVESYNSLEKKLQNALQAAQQHHQQLLTKEIEVQQQQQRLSMEKQNLYTDCEVKLQQCQLQYEGRLMAEKTKSEDLMEQVQRLKKQVSELSNKLSARDAEFDAYRQQILGKTESTLQAELTMLHLEKSELERKLSMAVKSKQHYKEQWSRALKELASVRQKEQAAAKEKLQRQQDELELMRMKYIRNEEQGSICRQLSEVKDEVSRLQQHTFNSVSAHNVSVPAQSAKEHESTLHSDVAHWIEERDILLQTGVYTSSDLTIQKLDQKIKAALNSKSS